MRSYSPSCTRQASQVCSTVQDMELLQSLQTAIQCGQRPHPSSCSHDGHHGSLGNTGTKRLASGSDLQLGWKWRDTKRESISSKGRKKKLHM